MRLTLPSKRPAIFQVSIRPGDTHGSKRELAQQPSRCSARRNWDAWVARPMRCGSSWWPWVEGGRTTFITRCTPTTKSGTGGHCDHFVAEVARQNSNRLPTQAPNSVGGLFISSAKPAISLWTNPENCCSLKYRQSERNRREQTIPTPRKSGCAFFSGRTRDAVL